MSRPKSDSKTKSSHWLAQVFYIACYGWLVVIITATEMTDGMMMAVMFHFLNMNTGNLTNLR